MKVEMRNDKTLIITPESTAEMIALHGFEGAKLSIEKPQPFTMNVEALKIERSEPPKS